MPARFSPLLATLLPPPDTTQRLYCGHWERAGLSWKRQHHTFSSKSANDANAIYVDVSGSRQRGGVDGMEGVDVVEGEYSGRAGV